MWHLGWNRETSSGPGESDMHPHRQSDCLSGQTQANRESAQISITLSQDVVIINTALAGSLLTEKSLCPD